MMLCKCLTARTNFGRRYLLNKLAVTSYLSQINSYSNIPQLTNQNEFNYNHKKTVFTSLTWVQKKYFSNGLIDGDISGFKNENELKKVLQLFPQPRVTLNELATKTPDKIFEIHYRQITVAPKGARKKVVQNGWICTYSFIWPEKMKFESTAISKRQAAEKAATQALQWLYAMKRIDNKGSPIYDKQVIENISTTLNEPIHMSISDKSMERIDKIWNDFENGISAIYEATFKEAQHKLIQTPAVVSKDSTIDEEDEFSDSEENSNDEDANDLAELRTHVHPVYGRHIKPPAQATMDSRDKVLRSKFERYDEELTPLPIDEYREQITSTLESSRVTVLVGAAGCGKSTRAPAAILRHFGAKTAAIVSEPRRVAAIGLAQRVANELGEEIGESIGYQVRLHSKPPRPPAGSVLYCTSGVLLKRLQANPGLAGCTHVFIDEAHERDVNTDVTLLLLKRALHLNPELKIIIMSATLDTEVFTRYFNSCPVIEVPGRTFPVEVMYLEDIQKRFNIHLNYTKENCTKEDGRPQVYCTEVAEVIKAVDKTEKEGAILVFLPGWAEIKQTILILDEHYGNSNTHMILPVHSRLSTEDQSKMFTKPPPGIRKIVLSTNIAETSITIPDVTHVIDTGAHKQNTIKQGTGIASLETVWVSQAGAKQRTGRAGRVQPGQCYRLYTKEKEAEFTPHTTPEILRVPLVQTVLDCKSYAPEDNVEEFLSQLPEPPTHKAIQFAINDLIDLGALTGKRELTSLGSILCRVSSPPRLSVCALHAAVLGAAVAAADVLTHCADNVDVFNMPHDRRDEIREFKRRYSATSDHCALHWIQDEFERNLEENGWKGVDEWCEKHGLRKDRLNYVKSLSTLHLEQVLKSGVIEPTVDIDELNRFSDIDELTAAILLSGTNSLLTTRRRVKTKGKLATANELFTSTGDRAHIGTESVNYAINKNNKTSLLAYFGGYHSVERRALVVYKTSLVPPHTAMLFCKGDLVKENEGEDGMAVLSLPRHKLQVHIPADQADNIIKAKKMLWDTLQYYIERDVRSLDYEENTQISRFKVRLVKTLGRILVEVDKDRSKVTKECT